MPQTYIPRTMEILRDLSIDDMTIVWNRLSPDDPMARMRDLGTGRLRVQRRLDELELRLASPLEPGPPHCTIVPADMIHVPPHWRMFVSVLSRDNPKKWGSKSYDRFSLYWENRRVAGYMMDVVAGGGTYSLASADIEHDRRRGYIELLHHDPLLAAS